jgi:hypothetical protein
VNWIAAVFLAAAGSERAELLIALVEANGCRMSGQEATEILPRHDFTQEETQRITTDLFSAGLIRIDRETDTLILRTEECM